MRQAPFRIRARAAVLLAAGLACLCLCAATPPARATTPGAAAPAASVVVAAADPDAGDTGGANPGESASPWRGTLAFIGWIVLGLSLAGLLVWMAHGASRRRARDPEGAPGRAPAPSPAASPFDPTMAHDLAALVFDHVGGAEHAFAAVRGRAGDASWMREVAFVECHHNGRIVVRGVFAGRWLDVEDVADAVRHEAVGGSAAEALVDVAFGHGGLEPGSSGLVLLAGAGDADAFVRAFDDHPARVTRHHLPPADMAALMTAVSGATPAAPPLTTRGAER